MYDRHVQAFESTGSSPPIADATHSPDPEGHSRAVASPWLSVVQAARHCGWPCRNGRAPASFYELADRIGYKIHGQWRIHIEDLDGYIRASRGGAA